MISTRRARSLRRGIELAYRFARTEPWTNYVRDVQPWEKVLTARRLFNPLDAAQERAMCRTAHRLHERGIW